MSFKIDNENRVGEIILNSGHNLIMGHKPPKLFTDRLANRPPHQINTDVESFGLFENSSPNYTTYYPDVTAEDLNPKDSEFIYPIYRMLSETIVSKGSNPIDFSKKGVLKKSMNKLLSQTVNIDHETAIGNAIGTVSEVFWQESYKDKRGIVVPAGINAVLKIDGKSNPRIARGIMMDPPSIHSNSVTVRFKWSPSHEFEESYEFYEKLGTYDNKGELIRIVVDEVLLYNETSLVSHGADPWAQKIGKDGGIHNPEYASEVYSFSADKPIKGVFNLDYKNHIESLSAAHSIPYNTNNNNKLNIKTKEMTNMLEKMISEFGFTDGELTEDNWVEKLQARFSEEAKKVQDLNEEVENLKSEVSTKDTQLEELQSEYDTLEANSEQVENVISLTRKEAARLYKLAKGSKVDDTILGIIMESDLKNASAFVKQYREEADENFSATCKKCGSNEVSRSTAVTSTDGLITDPTQNSGTPQEKTAGEVIRSLKEKNKRKSRIFRNQ